MLMSIRSRQFQLGRFMYYDFLNNFEQTKPSFVCVIFVGTARMQYPGNPV